MPTEFLSVLTEPDQQETDESAEDKFIAAVREFAQRVGVENVRVNAHDVPFAAFEGALAVSVLHHEADEYSRERSWLSGHLRIGEFKFDMHSTWLPADAIADLPDEDEPEA